jgi:hypothetical protein
MYIFLMWGLKNVKYSTRSDIWIKSSVLKRTTTEKLIFIESLDFWGNCRFEKY